MVVMRSCCCCSPRTGTLLISVIYMLFTGLIIVGLGLTLGYFTNYLQPIAISIIHDLPGNVTSSLTASVLSSMDSIRNIIIASLVLTSIYFFLCLLLFVGASKESSGYLTPWLVAEFFRQLIFFAAFCFLAWFVGVAIYKDKIQDDIETGFIALFCIVMLSTIALVFYLWLAVVGASQEFKEKETRVSPETKEPHEHTIHEAYVIYE